jgi:hypothetical protein
LRPASLAHSDCALVTRAPTSAMSLVPVRAAQP